MRDLHDGDQNNRSVHCVHSLSFLVVPTGTIDDKRRCFDLQSHREFHKSLTRLQSKWTCTMRIPCEFCDCDATRIRIRSNCSNCVEKRVTPWQWVFFTTNFVATAIHKPDSYLILRIHRRTLKKASDSHSALTSLSGVQFRNVSPCRRDAIHLACRWASHL